MKNTIRNLGIAALLGTFVGALALANGGLAFAHGGGGGHGGGGSGGGGSGGGGSGGGGSGGGGGHGGGGGGGGGGRAGGRASDFGGGAPSQHSFSQPSNHSAGDWGGAAGRAGDYDHRGASWDERGRRDDERARADGRNPNWSGGGAGRNGQANANANPRAGVNAPWYHGAWHGNWTPAWGQHPAGWAYAGNAYQRWPYAGLGRTNTIGNHGSVPGVSAIGVSAAILASSSPYAYGYWGYTNPFYGGGPGWNGYNYSQPLASAEPPAGDPAANPNPPNPGPPNPNGNGLTDGSQAPDVADVDPPRDAFKKGDFQTALELTDKDLISQPGDPVLHQFRALCEFALGHYQESAAGVYSVLAAGPGWDWTTLVNLYAGVDVYTQQLRALEAYSRENPDAADARFLLAFHYLIQGYDGAAEQQFREVTRLQPNNTVAAQMFKTLTNPSATEPDMPDPAATTDQPATPIDAGAIVGRWTATTPDGGKFVLSLDTNQAFVWKFGRPEKMTTLQGKYTLSGNMLILEGTDQQNLAGQVKLEANRLNFRLPGGNANDPGLNFVR